MYSKRLRCPHMMQIGSCSLATLSLLELPVNWYWRGIDLSMSMLTRLLIFADGGCSHWHSFWWHLVQYVSDVYGMVWSLKNFFNLYMVDGIMLGFGHRNFNKVNRSFMALYVRLFDVANFMMAQLAEHNEISLSE